MRYLIIYVQTKCYKITNVGIHSTPVGSWPPNIIPCNNVARTWGTPSYTQLGASWPGFTSGQKVILWVNVFIQLLELKVSLQQTWNSNLLCFSCCLPSRRLSGTRSTPSRQLSGTRSALVGYLGGNRTCCTQSSCPRYPAQPCGERPPSTSCGTRTLRSSGHRATLYYAPAEM